MSAMDSLLAAAERGVSEYSGTRRPTWAPPLVLSGELAQCLLKLGYLPEEGPRVARLWAQFTDPRRGPVKCVGFELRAGTQRSGREIFHCGKGRSGTWGHGPHWLPPKNPDYRWKYELLSRATELAAERVAEFAGDPTEQMRLGGMLTGNCACCGRGLTDPISIERGIGPECWSQQEAAE